MTRIDMLKNKDGSKKPFDLSALVRPNVAQLNPYSSARDEFKSSGMEMVFFDANENPFDNGYNRYPDPQQTTLKARLSDLKKIAHQQILLGNGSDEVLDLIFRAFCEPHRDNIITVPPTYGMYKVLAATNAIKNKEIQLSEKFQLQPEKILDAVDPHTKLIFICSPNNPSGNLMAAEDISLILDNFNGLVVLDEAYADFSTGESWINSLNRHANLIVTQTFSKAYGMAAIRLGMCYASAEIINLLNKIKPPYNINELTQQYALKRLENDTKVRREIDLIIQERKFLIKKLNTLDFVKLLYPSEANFILVKVDNAELRYKELLSKGAVVRNRNEQPLCDNCLRLTVGTPDQNTFLWRLLKEMDLTKSN